MEQKDLMEYFLQLAENHYPDGFNNVVLPPPVFLSMGAEFTKIDQENAEMEVKFPIPISTLNPFGSMQGGIIAAAVDNAVGSLSILVGPMNFTRDMTLKYRRPVSKDFEYIIVKATFTGQKGRRLFFSAEVMDPEGNILVKAKVMNWIVEKLE